MQVAENLKTFTSKEITKLIKENYSKIMPSFYETQSLYLSGIYKRYRSIETANIILCFIRNMHLEIMRQREKNLNFDISIKSFWINLNNVPKPAEKIVSIVQFTGIPKETVRRKIASLLSMRILAKAKNTKGYSWNLPEKQKDYYYKIIDEEIRILSKFISKFTTQLKLNLSIKLIEDEIKSQFSFYWYHFLSCQLNWLKMWQIRLKDNDLLLIALQAIIPTLQYADKNVKSINSDNIFKIVGKTSNNYDFSNAAVSATTVSEATGIPRATCFRKLGKLVSLRFLSRESKTKRYFINQNLEDRTKNIITKENVDYTIETFGNYLAIILNSLIQNRK